MQQSLKCGCDLSKEMVSHLLITLSDFFLVSESSRWGSNKTVDYIGLPSLLFNSSHKSLIVVKFGNKWKQQKLPHPLFYFQLSDKVRGPTSAAYKWNDIRIGFNFHVKTKYWTTSPTRYLRWWPRTSTWPRKRPPRGTGRCSGVADGCSRTPGCARRPPTLCWSPESSCGPRSPPGHGHGRHLPRPWWWKWTTGGWAASGRRRKAGILALVLPGAQEQRQISCRKWTLKRRFQALWCVGFAPSAQVQYRRFPLVVAALLQSSQWTSPWTRLSRCAPSACQISPNRVVPGPSCQWNTHPLIRWCELCFYWIDVCTQPIWWRACVCACIPHLGMSVLRPPGSKGLMSQHV